MSKKALCNLVVGDKVFKKDEIYKDEDVVNIDLSNFQDVEAEATAEVDTGVAHDEQKEKKIDPNAIMDTGAGDESVDDKKKEEESVAGSQGGENSTEGMSGFEKGE